MSKFDHIEEVNKHIDHIDHVEKFNPYHDAKGRFASASGYSSFTFRTKDPKKQHMADMAIAREKERAAAVAVAPKEETKEEKIQRLQGSSVEESIRNTENEHRNQDFETLTAINKNGEIVLLKDGREDEVQIDIFERNRIQGSTVTHNHPNSSCFSVSDIRTFIELDLQEIRATKRGGGAYSLKMRDPLSGDWSIVEKYFYQRERATERAQKKLAEKGYAQKIRSGEMTQKQANDEMCRLVSESNARWLKRYANNYGYIYSEE